MPRCPYEVLRTDRYDSIVCDDMFKLLVWDCYSWSAWQFFRVKDRKGRYREIPGSRAQYAGCSSLWQLSYSIILYIRMEFEKHGLSFQTIYDVPPGVEVPWLTYRQFGNLVGNVTDLVIARQNWQPVIDAIWENRDVEDYDARNSAVKTDFMRKWHHDRSGSSLSLDEMTEDEVFDAAGSRGEFEQSILSQMQINILRRAASVREIGKSCGCGWRAILNRKSQTGWAIRPPARCISGSAASPAPMRIL